MTTVVLPLVEELGDVLPAKWRTAVLAHASKRCTHKAARRNVTSHVDGLQRHRCDTCEAKAPFKELLQYVVKTAVRALQRGTKKKGALSSAWLCWEWLAS